MLLLDGRYVNHFLRIHPVLICDNIMCRIAFKFVLYNGSAVHDADFDVIEEYC